MLVLSTRRLPSTLAAARNGKRPRDTREGDRGPNFAGRYRVGVGGVKGGVVGRGGGADVDYAQLVKLSGAAPDGGRGRYRPAERTGIEKNRIEGNPDMEHVPTSFVERSNLIMRMYMRRFTRLTNASSEKVEDHAHAVALFTSYHNFVRIPG